MEISALESTIALPCHGRLNDAHQIFDFLRMKYDFLAVFDPSVPDLDLSKLPRED